MAVFVSYNVFCLQGVILTKGDSPVQEKIALVIKEKRFSFPFPLD